VIAVMSIFVNPLQFGPTEDLARYPRDLERDAVLAEAAGVDAIFAPSVTEMYPAQSRTFVDVQVVTDKLCGTSRPGHFRGVTTVVSKLFNIVQPDTAYFGQKDAQQIRVIQQMVADLNLPVRIETGAIIREEDGLAMSSRNVFLSAEERSQALSISRGLRAAETLYRQGERLAETLMLAVRNEVQEQPLARIDYIKVVDWQDFAEPSIVATKSLLAVAVYFGNTRLIDNTMLQEVE
jgi:pantoate--beta-alanine ligase